jgi:photosystem II stability/assembly factor-like uncharacterized protein
MDASNPARLVLGTDHVYETTNKGDSWTAIASPNVNGFNPRDDTVDAVAISKTSPNTIYVTTHGYTPNWHTNVFVTTNDGGTWTEIDVPNYNNADVFTDVRVDPTNSQTAYLVRSAFTGGSGGHVFKTTNGGTTWTDISAGLPDLPTWAVALDLTGGTLYVGNDTGVYLSSDGGQNWARLGTGLPNVQVHQLENNQTLGILGAATFGRGL